MNKFLTLIISVLLSIAFIPTASAATGDELLRFLPQNSRAVGVIDLASMRGSSTLEQILSSVESQSDYARIQHTLEKTGFNPGEQTHTIAIGVTSLSANARPIIIASGDFPRQKLEKSLREEEKATVSQVAGHTVFEVDDRGATVFLADNIIAVGPRSLINTAIAQSSNTSPQFNGTLSALVQRADRSRSIWFASQSVSNDKTQGTNLAKALGVVVSMNVSNGLALKVNLPTRSTTAAQQLTEDLQSRLSTLKSRDEVAALGLAPVVEAIEASTNGHDTVITLNLDQSTWNRVFHTLKSIIVEELR